MAKLALIVSDLGPNGARAIDLLRREFGMSIPAVRAAVGSGRPLVESPIFDRRDPEQPQRLIRTLEALDGLGSQYKAYQILDSAEYVPGRNYLELTPERLRARVADRAASIAEQQRYTELQGDAE